MNDEHAQKSGDRSASNSNDLLNANKVELATGIINTVVDRLEGNKTTPEWLLGSIGAVQVVLCGLRDDLKGI